MSEAQGKTERQEPLRMNLQSASRFLGVKRNLTRNGVPWRAMARNGGRSQIRSRKARYTDHMKRPRFTYFIQLQTGGPIKIGKSSDIKLRMNAMQCASPIPFVCLGYFAYDCEIRLHELFDHLAIGGEWFAPDDSLLEHIRLRAIKSGLTCRVPTPAEKRVQRQMEQKRRGRSRHYQYRPSWLRA